MENLRSIINRLNCMNYQIDNEDGHYYLQDGLNSLRSFCKRCKIDFHAVRDTLIRGERFDGGDFSITMI